MNTDYNIPLGVDSKTVPQMIVYPAFHKNTLAYQYEGTINGIKMSRFLYEHVDLKFKWKAKFFQKAHDPMEGSVQFDVDEHGNPKPSMDKIKEVQDKQNREEAEKQAYIDRMEKALSREDL